MSTFIFSMIGSIIGSYMMQRLMNKIQSRKEDEREAEHILVKLSIMFKDIKNQHFAIKVLEKSPKKRYIKIGVFVTDEGIAEALICGSPFAEVKEMIRLHSSWTSSNKKKPFIVEAVLIENMVDMA